MGRSRSHLSVVKNGKTLQMPDVAGMSNIEAALAYAVAGMHIVPVQKGTKNPGNVVGDGWPAASTTDKECIRYWWGQDPEYGIALHCGKSGLVVVDVDDVDQIPETWYPMLGSAPCNNTRSFIPGKGHYFFRMPPGRTLGNGMGKLPRGWGDIRGANGVVILPPSTHPGEMPNALDKDEGGEYSQRRSGVIPELPAFFADMMNDAKPGEYMLDDAELKEFLEQYADNSKPKLLPNVVASFIDQSEGVGPRHTTLAACLCWAMREAYAGLYSAKKVVDELGKAFYAALSDEGRERTPDGREFGDMVKWAAAQALASDPAKTRREVRERGKSRSGDSPKQDCELGGESLNLDWLVDELGRNGLSGIMRRGITAAYTPLLGQEGYLPPQNEKDDDGPAQVREVDAEHLATLVSRRYNVFRENKDGGYSHPLFPKNVASGALKVIDEAPNLRVLRGVAHTPMIRKDGSTLIEPGYDDGTRYLYLPTVAVPPVPATPSPQAVHKATALLVGLLADFDWRTEHDMANVIGVMLTPLLRPVVPPPYMGLAINAHQPGSGKSLLGKILRTVHGGVLRSEMPHDEAELGKSITGILSGTTAPIVEFDNVTGVLKSGKLAGILTTSELSDRLLGSTNETQLVNNRVWIFTGNNIQLGGDLPRRFVWCTIDSKTPHPEQRTEFKIPDLSKYVEANRGQILNALLTLAANWNSKGMPVRGKVPATDYGRWQGAVRTILELAGVPGVFGHSDSVVQDEGVDDDNWAEFLARVWEAHQNKKWTVSHLLARPDDKSKEAISDWREIISNLPGDLSEKFVKESRTGAEGGSTSKSLGRWLMNRKGRWANNLTIREAGRQRGTNLWRLEKYGP